MTSIEIAKRVIKRDIELEINTMKKEESEQIRELLNSKIMIDSDKEFLYDVLKAYQNVFTNAIFELTKGNKNEQKEI